VNYAEALAWLYETQQHGIKLGLDNIHRLLDALGWHGREQRFVHVAGTNGKGSVCAMLDAICRAQGIRTGLFTSPHLVTFRERIRIDGEMISQADVAKGLAKIREFVSDWETHPTFFEITTALALDHFQHEKVDVVALETGMGGRLDSTNIVKPVASVITAIDFDHQAWLGDTLREIAGEKAGIIKLHVPVISVPQHDEATEILRQTAEKQYASIRFVNEPLQKYKIALVGEHQKLNAAVAVAALHESKIEISDSAIRTGLKNVAWPGRFQQINDRVVLDGAHNPSAATRLSATWREIFGDERVTVVLGILKDKDIRAICDALAPISSGFVATPVRSQRSSTAEEVCAAIQNARCKTAANLADALKIAQQRAGKILVTGSLFLIGEALAHFGVVRDDPEIISQ